MKIKLSKSQWDKIGDRAGWKVAQTQAEPTKFYNCMIDISGSNDPEGFKLALRDLCVKYSVKLDVVKNTIDI